MLNPTLHVVPRYSTSARNLVSRPSRATLGARSLVRSYLIRRLQVRAKQQQLSDDLRAFWRLRDRHLV